MRDDESCRLQAEFCGVKIAIWLIPFRLKGTSFGGSFQVVSGLNEDIKAAEKGSAHKQEFK